MRLRSRNGIQERKETVRRVERRETVEASFLIGIGAAAILFGWFTAAIVHSIMKFGEYEWDDDDEE